jgi:predicted acyl esterase
LLGYNCPSVVDRAETSYPPSYVKHNSFFLDCANGTLRDGEPTASASLKYLADSWDDDGAHFSLKFHDYTELIGFSKVKLYMSCPDTDDMDVYVILRKLDQDGNHLLHINIPLDSFPSGTTEDDVPNANIFKYVGPGGRLRASHRRIEPDPHLSHEQSLMIAPGNVWHPHDREEKIPPGQVTCLEIAIWPGGMVFQAGESIRLEIKGHEATLPEFPALERAPTNLNLGYHIVHSGPDYPSSIVLPLVSGKGSS